MHKSIIAVISCKLKSPNFASQTKSKLVSPEARTKVESFLNVSFKQYLEENPALAKQIVNHILEHTKERLAIEKTQETFKDKHKVSKLPGKLADCSEFGDIFLVEGDSAAGTTMSCRDSRIHAILALKGKVMNAERADIRKLLKNEEISALISVMGTGIGKDFDLSKLRYRRIVILSDADVDGAHIGCLILTFFVNFMPEIVKSGRLYLAKPPLYRLREGKNIQYIQTTNELDKLLFTRLINKHSLTDGNGNPLSLDDVIELYHNCKNLLKKLKAKYVSDERLASVCSLAGSIQDVNGYIKNVFSDLKVELDFGENCVSVNSTSMYGSTTFHVDLSKTIHHVWPISVNNEKIYDPVSLYKYLSKLYYEGVEIQRFKGLGEMNPDQLEPVLKDPSNWYVVYGEESIWEVIRANMKDIMGDESDRKGLVRNYYHEDNEVVSF